MTSAWVLSFFTNEKNYNNSKIIQELKKRSVDCKFLSLEKMLSKRISILDNDNPNDIYYENFETLLERPDLIILTNSIRISDLKNLSSKYNIIVNTLKRWEEDTLIINDVFFHSFASSKHNVYRLLKENDIPIPKTFVFEEKADSDALNQIIEELGDKIVVKPVDSYSGRGVTLQRSKEDVLKAINDIRNEKIEIFKQFSQQTEEQLKTYFEKFPVILQQYQADSAGLMAAVRVIGDDIKGCFCLGSPYTDENFKSELGAGRMQIAMKIDNNLEELIKKTMKVLNLEIARFDVFVSNGNYKICEVNVPGGSNRIDYIHNTNQASTIVDYCLSRLGKKHD